MEDFKPEGTAPIVETIKAEEMIPQSQVGGIVAKETKQAIEKMLKDLGVEDFKSAKDGLSKFKEIQEAQKTEVEKTKEQADTYKAKFEALEVQVKQSKIDNGVKSILTEMNVDEKHMKTILKLADLNGVYEDDLDTDKLKAAITKTLEEELSMLMPEKGVTVGTPKVEKEISIGSNQYLEAYKKLKK